MTFEEAVGPDAALQNPQNQNNNPHSNTSNDCTITSMLTNFLLKRRETGTSASFPHFQGQWSSPGHTAFEKSRAPRQDHRLNRTHSGFQIWLK